MHIKEMVAEPMILCFMEYKCFFGAYSKGGSSLKDPGGLEGIYIFDTIPAHFNLF